MQVSIAAVVQFVEERKQDAIANADGAGGRDNTNPDPALGSIAHPGAVRGPGDPLSRQWIWFIGFYTKKIIKDFCTSANAHNLAGFLMPGKPAVACCEGLQADIDEFVRVTRTDTFARVPSASKKMTLCLLEEDISADARLFTSFTELQLTSSDRSHKRKDMTDLGAFKVYLQERGCSHVFASIFGDCT